MRKKEFIFESEHVGFFEKLTDKLSLRAFIWDLENVPH